MRPKIAKKNCPVPLDSPMKCYIKERHGTANPETYLEGVLSSYSIQYTVLWIIKPIPVYLQQIALMTLHVFALHLLEDMGTLKMRDMKMRETRKYGTPRVAYVCPLPSRNA